MGFTMFFIIDIATDSADIFRRVPFFKSPAANLSSCIEITKRARDNHPVNRQILYPPEYHFAVRREAANRYSHRTGTYIFGGCWTYPFWISIFLDADFFAALPSVKSIHFLSTVFAVPAHAFFFGASVTFFVERVAFVFVATGFFFVSTVVFGVFPVPVINDSPNRSNNEKHALLEHK